MKVGLYGGTFDPIHIGHLLLAEWTRVKLNLNKIIFLPALIPPHKQDHAITKPQSRLQMVQLAIQENPYFQASDFEIEKGDISYSIETILRFKELYHLSNRQLYFLVGADSIIDFPAWRAPDKILQNCRVVVYRRPNFDLLTAQTKYMSKVIQIDNPIIEISSSDIRQRVSKGYSIKYLVPYCIEEFIFNNALYKKM